MADPQADALARLAGLPAQRRAIADAVRARVGAGARHRTAGDGPTIDGYLDELTVAVRPAVYRAVTTALGPVLGRVFAPPGAPTGLADRLEIAGPVADLRALAAAGTLVFAPTHSSNLDAIVLGMALREVGLPACAYAAGEHLFRNPIVAALIRDLGGFRVDRGRRGARYLAVLTAYLAALIERGVHTVVFPGATRCRSGEVEATVRLGLINAAIRAGAAAGRRVHVVPVTINHQIVIEAATLIDYHLRGRGHERVVGDELFVPGRLRATLGRLRALDQRVVIGLGAPIAAGAALAPAALVAAFRRDTVFLDTHVVARALADLAPLASGAPMRGGPVGAQATVAAAVAAIAATARLLDAEPAGGRRWRPGRRPDELLTTAIAAWHAGHVERVASVVDGWVRIDDPALIGFYANRTRHVVGR